MSSSCKYDSVIFDLDGTITDSSYSVKQAVKYTLNHLNLPEQTDSKLDELMLYSPLKEALKTVCGLSDDTAQECCIVFKNYYSKNSDNLLSLTRTYVGIKEVLYKLKQEKCKLGITTHKHQEQADKMLNTFDITSFFSSVCGSDHEYSLSKGQLLLKCIEELGSKPDTTVYIGDSRYDALAAQHAKCDFIAVIYGYGFKSPSEAKEFTSFAAETPSQILEFLSLGQS